MTIVPQHPATHCHVDTIATYTIAAVALVLSYSKLTDLALRAGYDETMAHCWPLIVDGLALVATRGVMRLRTARWYAWLLLVAGTAISIVAAVASAVLPAGPLPGIAAACVYAVPPLCVPFALHLAVLMRRQSHPATHTDAQVSTADDATYNSELTVAEVAPEPADAPQPEPIALDIAPDDRRAAALRLLDTTDMSQRAVAREIGVSEATVRRWLKPQSRARAV